MLSRRSYMYTINNLWSVWYCTIAVAFQVSWSQYLQSWRTFPYTSCVLATVRRVLWECWECQEIAATCIYDIILQVYIIFSSIRRFHVYMNLSWPNGEPPLPSSYAYIVLIAAGVVILPFFIIVSLMRVGNYANDGNKLGRSLQGSNSGVREENIYSNVSPSPSMERNKRRKRFRLLRIIWKHSVPTAPFLHMLAALCFLMPRILMEAQLIKEGILRKG